MKTSSRKLLIFNLGLLLHYCPAILAQDIYSQGLELNEARKNQVDILSQENFELSQKNLEEAQQKLAISKQYLQKAQAEAVDANIKLKNVLEARKLALNAHALIFYPTEFQKTDNYMQKIIKEISNNKVINLDVKLNQLKSNYLDFELRAIKHQSLAQARLILFQAIQDGAKKYAPNDLLDVLRKYRSITTFINQHRHEEESIKNEANLLVKNAENLLQTTHRLANKNDIEFLENFALDSIENETHLVQSSLQKNQLSIIDKMAIAKSQLMPNEAKITRNNNAIKIQLIGIQFPISKANLNDTDIKILGKLQRLLKEFNTKSIVIEGHTDSTGSESLNDNISKERAQVIKDYLLSTDVIQESGIRIVGLKDQSPIASNQTATGRMLNRRVDIVIDAL